MKLLPLLLALTLSGCAVPFDSSPPWRNMIPTHTPLMLGHPDIVSSDDELETPSLSP